MTSSTISAENSPSASPSIFRRLGHFALSSLALIAGANAAAAQSAPPISTTPTMQVNVKVVTMAVTVRDKHGAIVPNLKPDDFALTEDGRPQTIKYFNVDTNLP